MKITLNDDRLRRALERLDALPDQLPAIAAQVQGETLGMAVINARANIYNTAPGAYQRTQDYLRGLNAQARATQTRVQVTVSNDSDHALPVETGRGGTLPALQAQALARGGAIAAPFTLGRSGVNWFKPGPIITGTQVFAAKRMQRLFADQVLRARRG